MPALRQAQLREVRGEDPEQGTAGRAGQGWQRARRARQPSPEWCSHRQPGEPRAPAPKCKTLPTPTADWGRRQAGRWAGRGVWGLHSPSTCFRDRYLRASSSRMTGRDIWSTATHWRPFSGVTWKMSWDGGVLIKGRSAQSPPHPPLHTPPTTVDSSQTPLRCAPRPASRSVSTQSPLSQAPSPALTRRTKSFCPGGKWEEFCTGKGHHLSSCPSLGGPLFFFYFFLPLPVLFPKSGRDVLKWGTHLADQGPAPCGHGAPSDLSPITATRQFHKEAPEMPSLRGELGPCDPRSRRRGAGLGSDSQAGAAQAE